MSIEHSVKYLFAIPLFLISYILYSIMAPYETLWDLMILFIARNDEYTELYNFNYYVSIFSIAVTVLLTFSLLRFIEWCRGWYVSQKIKRFYGLWKYDATKNTKIVFYIYKKSNFPLGINIFSFEKFQLLVWECKQGCPDIKCKPLDAQYDLVFQVDDFNKRDYNTALLIKHTKEGTTLLYMTVPPGRPEVGGTASIQVQYFDGKQEQFSVDNWTHKIPKFGTNLRYCKDRDLVLLERDIADNLKDWATNTPTP